MAEVETWKGRVYQLEQLLRSVQRDVSVESLPLPVRPMPVKTPQPKQPDLDHYVAIAEHTQKRAEQLERETLEVSISTDSSSAAVTYPSSVLSLTDSNGNRFRAEGTGQQFGASRLCVHVLGSLVKRVSCMKGCIYVHDRFL